MTDMVERVARAINPEAFEKWKGGSFAGAYKHPFFVEEALNSARAAIEAMREPTPDMRGWAVGVYEEALKKGSYSPNTDVYRAMIDAALKGKSDD